MVVEAHTRHTVRREAASADLAREGPREGVELKPIENRSERCDTGVEDWLSRSREEQDALHDAYHLTRWTQLIFAETGWM